MHSLFYKILPLIVLVIASNIRAQDSISLSYGYGNLPKNNNASGETIQFMHVPQNTGLIGSITYLHDNNDKNTKYASVFFGPAFKVSSNIYTYGMLGVAALSKVKENQANELYGPGINVGVYYYVSPKVLLNAGLEVSHSDMGMSKIFQVGLGYGF